MGHSPEERKGKGRKTGPAPDSVGEGDGKQDLAMPFVGLLVGGCLATSILNSSNTSPQHQGSIIDNSSFIWCLYNLFILFLFYDNIEFVFLKISVHQTKLTESTTKFVIHHPLT